MPFELRDLEARDGERSAKLSMADIRRFRNNISIFPIYLERVYNLNYKIKIKSYPKHVERLV